MKMLRSIAFCAMALVASAFAIMPAAAAIPIDPGIHASALEPVTYPAPVIVDTDHAALTCEAPSLAVSVALRSPAITSSNVLALTSEPGASIHLVGLRRRC